MTKSQGYSSEGKSNTIVDHKDLSDLWTKISYYFVWVPYTIYVMMRRYGQKAQVLCRPDNKMLGRNTFAIMFKFDIL